MSFFENIFEENGTIVGYTARKMVLDNRWVIGSHFDRLLNNNLGYNTTSYTVECCGRNMRYTCLGVCLRL